ncbi:MULTISPECIES: helix-turn-helix domain-containing protein [Arsenophonus]|jgi:SOS-response transcriptional repressor LexA|uniref:helix-turn-helix domain-containing protein n=1 Tax=Arsenophonus TaxID=637 RepID=UPI0015D6933F|nr:helix-turn-helix domain-containing protein [Arsenophonus endosymbiont of Apis mellifera]
MQKENTIISKGDNLLIKLIAKNLTRLMNEKNIESQQLSDITGLGIATVNSLKRGVGNPTLTTLEVLAKFFNTSVSELIEKKEEGVLSKVIVDPMPLVSLSRIDNYIDNNLFEDTFIAEIGNHPSTSLFAIKVDNDTLNPYIPIGTICIVSKVANVKDGDITLVKINHHTPFFRRVYIESKHLAFSPIMIESNPTIYENYELLGVVIKKIRSF